MLIRLKYSMHFSYIQFHLAVLGKNFTDKLQIYAIMFHITVNLRKGVSIMKMYVKVIYGISLSLVFFMLIFFHIHEKADKYIARDEAECSILTDYEVTSYANKSAPIGITQEYQWTLNDVPKRGSAVTFYVVHQEIEIYLEDELVYSLMSGENNLSSKTTGYNWAKVYLYPEDEGKDIRILVHPIYKTSIRNNLTIYYGNYDTICSVIFQNSLFIFVLGIVLIIIGLAFITFVLINLKNHEIDTSIAMLGIFSICAGLWKICDMTSAPLLFGDSVTLSALTHAALPMMLLPYLFFIRNQFAQNRHKFWDFLCTACSLVSIVIVVLQLTGIADLRQTLPLCHAMILVCILSVVTIFLLEVCHTKFSVNLRITVICCLLCLLGTVIDMIVYYYSGDSGSMVFCLLAFLIYVVLMGYMSVRDALRLIERGKEAKKYEQLAMHDELTGLYNRAFYAQYSKKHDLQQSNCCIIMFDVNNLKQCNDTIGHDCGDRLLKNSAQLLKQAFSPNGKCIRIGGDEFCVLLQDSAEKECQEYLKKFDKLCDNFNKLHPDEFPINIAYGYAHYNEDDDFDFGDTLRRADKKMYQMKLAMKTGT